MKRISFKYLQQLCQEHNAAPDTKTFLKVEPNYEYYELNEISKNQAFGIDNENGRIIRQIKRGTTRDIYHAINSTR